MIKCIGVTVVALIIAVAGYLIGRSQQDEQATHISHTKAEYAEQVANVYVSAYPVIPWVQIADKLEPKNSLSIEQARLMATQTTAVEVEQYLLTRALGLAIGLPGGSPAAPATTAGKPSDNQQSSQPPNVPPSSGMPSASITTPTGPPDLAKAPVTLGVNGNTILTAGTALYQQSQILDNQISKGFLPESYQAHLLTLQVNVQPKRHDVSYDAYTDVDFLPGNWTEALSTSDEVHQKNGGLPPIVVYPLIIMDAIEMTNAGRSVEAVRQASLTLSGIIRGAGVNAGGSGGNANVQSNIGLEKSSLITVGRVSDHAVRIRLGAENAGPKGLALVPRSYNISLLILTRWDETDEAKRVKSIEAVTYTSLVSIEDGSTLRSNRNREDLAKRVRKSIHNFGFGVVSNQCIERMALQVTPNNCKEAPYNENASLTAEEIDTNLNLLRAVDRADYGEITSCLCQQPNIDLPREIKLRRLLVDLIEAQFDSRYSKLLIPLEERTAPMLPAADQLGLYTRR